MIKAAIWLSAEQPGGKRLKAALPLWRTKSGAIQATIASPDGSNTLCFQTHRFFHFKERPGSNPREELDRGHSRHKHYCSGNRTLFVDYWVV